MSRVLRYLLILVAFSQVLVSCSTMTKGTVFQTGFASWYGRSFQGRTTASGEKFHMFEMTAAHRSLPFGSKVLVRSKTTGKSVEVRINDRGPFSNNRVIDLSIAAAQKLQIVDMGQDEVDLIL